MKIPEKYRAVLLIFFSVVLYFLFAYFLERTEFNSLLFLWISLFACFYLLMKNKAIHVSTLIGLTILFRLIFLFAIPNLSQDFYRFIWDGRMLFEGLNPYLSLPQTFIEQGIKIWQKTIMKNPGTILIKEIVHVHWFSFRIVEQALQ